MMTRAFRKRIQRLAQSPPPPIRQGDRQNQVVDSLYQRQYVRTVELLARLGPDNGPEIALELARSLHESSEEAWKAAAELFPEDLKRVECKEGCAFCCQEPLQVHILDAVAVAGGRRGQPLNYQLPTRERQRLKSIFQPCPFLQDQRCSVYSHRPVICRAYHSTDLGRCRQIIEQGDSARQVPMHLGLYGLTGMPQEATQRVFEEVGIDRRPVVLGLAVAALIDNFDPMVCDWLTGGSAFDEVAVLESEGGRILHLPVV